MTVRRRRARALGIVLPVGTLLVSWVGTAAPARADSETYVNNLKALGIQVPRGDNELKEMGWEVCALFDLGVAPDQVLYQAVYNSRSKPPYGMTVKQANAIVDNAVSQLCGPAHD